MPFTQADLIALDTARKQGARRVRIDNKDVEFDSVDDYIKLRNVIQNELTAANPLPVRQVRVYTKRG